MQVTFIRTFFLFEKVKKNHISIVSEVHHSPTGPLEVAYQLICQDNSLKLKAMQPSLPIVEYLLLFS